METTPNIDTRSYRKSLDGFGLIYLGNVEHEIRLLNVSLTGLLAEMQCDEQLKEVKDIFNAICDSPMVDLYLPHMRLAGEAEIVRVMLVDGCFQIGLEFRNLSYDIDDLLYSRKAYRKNMHSPGQIVFNDKSYTFITENVSVFGMMIRIVEHLELDIGIVARIDFEKLDLRGEVQVVWIERHKESTWVGLQYLRLEKAQISGVPRFVRE